jgi:predicted dehydrogenase
MLNVGLIGCGVISNLNVLGYISSKDAKVVAVADTDRENARQKLERWGLRISHIYDDYREMIKKEDLDVVEVLTPHHLHYPMVKNCAEAGVPAISVQKPMAHTISDCENMIKVCKKNDVKLKVFENFIFAPHIQEAKRLLDKGVIGERLNFRINTILTAGPHMPYSLIKSYLWRVKVEKCGGGPLVYDDGIHKFSLALWLMDQERVDTVYAWIDFFSGIMDGPANIFWKYPAEADEPPRYGSMEFSLAPNLYFPSNYYACEEFIEISGSKGMMWINQCTSAGNFLSESPQYPPIVVFSDGKVNSYGQGLPLDWRYSFINSTEHFIKAVKKDKQPLYTGDQGKNLSIFAKMPYISNQEKRKVSWKEISPLGEANNSCIVENFFSLKSSIFRMLKHNWRVKKDLKKGKKQGLQHTDFDYESYYEGEN